jgi:mono/diheme cytochrome c family protein
LLSNFLIAALLIASPDGKALYERFCISCHGEHGDGHGYSAQWLDPRPRDFTRGVFKCRSTPSSSIPLDADLLRTLRTGLPHTNMVSFKVLGEPQLLALIEYIKGFSPRFKEEQPIAPIPEVPEPPDDEASRKKGLVVWNAQGCANCHGQTGRGDGPSVATLVDDWGYPARPFDFTASPRRKCGDTPKDLYRTFLSGIAGSPMPSYIDTITPEEAWHLVHYLQTLHAP